MKLVPSIVLLALSACASTESSPGSFPEAQRIVEQVAARHPDLVRLTVHAVPRDATTSRIVASNVASKIGRPSDCEDLEAMRTKRSVTLKEGDRVDLTAPVIDASGAAVAAVGVLVGGTHEGAMRASAESIAKELSDALLAVGKPLW